MVEVTLASEAMVGVISRIAATGKDFGPWLPRAAYLAAIRQSRILVATEDERVYGFCWYVPREDDFWQLQKIVVAPPARGKGVGRLLVETLCEEADSVNAGVRLKVTTDNHVALSLYQTLAFSVVRKAGKAPHEVYVMERNSRV